MLKELRLNFKRAKIEFGKNKDILYIAYKGNKYHVSMKEYLSKNSIKYTTKKELYNSLMGLGDYIKVLEIV